MELPATRTANTVPRLPPYIYRCIDRSVLVGPFRRYWAGFFLRSVSPRVPANLVTLGASACMWALLACAVLAVPAAPVEQAWLFAALLHAYVVYDHVDGMQAKRCGTSSALGEYLDHSLDVYHGAIAVLAIFSLVGFDRPALLLAALGCSHVAFAATMVEEKERGELYLGTVGALEGVLLFIAFCLSWSVEAVRAWWLAPLAGGWPAYAFLVAAGAVGALCAVAGCLRRIGRVPLEFLCFALGHGLLVVALVHTAAPTWGAIAVLMLHGGDYAGRVIGSHLLGTRRAWPDCVAPAAGAVLLLWPDAGTAATAAATWPWVIAFLTAWTALGIGRVLWPLRGAWRWRNPVPLPSP